MTLCVYAFAGFLSNFALMLNAQSPIITAIQYDPRDFERQNLTHLYPKNGTAFQPRSSLQSDPLPTNCPDFDLQSLPTHCQIQCRTSADCADTLSCCPTKCGGRLCRRPPNQLQQQAPPFAIDQLGTTNLAEDVKQLKQRMEEIELSLTTLNFALKQLKPEPPR